MLPDWVSVPPLRAMVWPDVRVSGLPFTHTVLARLIAKVTRSVPTIAAAWVMTVPEALFWYGWSRTCTWNVSPGLVDFARMNSPLALKS